MKKAKFAAAIILAAAMGATTLAACGSKNLGAEKFNISEYAHPLDSAYAKTNLVDYGKSNARDAYTMLIKKRYTNVSSIGNVGFASARVNNGGTSSYALFDVKHNTEIAANLYAEPDYYTCSGGKNGTVYFYKLVKQAAKEGESSFNYSYIAPDGSLLTAHTFTESYAYASKHISMSYENSYEDKAGNWLDFYKVTYIANKGESNEKEVEKFYSYSKDGKGEVIWEEVDEETAKGPESKYSAGTLVGLAKTELIADCAKLYPDSAYNGMEYSVEGTVTKQTYTFYKDDQKLSSITVTQGDIIGYAGNYVYFTENELVDVDAAKGYNLEITTGLSSVKSNVTLYRYDFVNGKGLKKISTGDYVVLEGKSLYNYEKGEFDAIAIHASKKVKGVAVVTADVMNLGLEINMSTVILNEKGKVCADLTGTVLGNLSGSDIFKLKEGRYLAGNSILDDECKPVAQFTDSAKVWKEKELLQTYVSGYGFMFVNYDGLVVIEPATVSFQFYGDAAYSNGKIYSAEYPSGATVEEVISVNKDTDYFEISNGLIFKTTPVEKTIISTGDYAYSETVTTFKVTVYSLSGTQLGTMTDLTSPAFNVNVMGGNVLVNATAYTEVATGETQMTYWIIL